MSLELTRYPGNPILQPTDNWWEKKQVFNPAVVVKGGKIHMLYRAQGRVPVSNIGYARFSDPTTIDIRRQDPVIIGNRSQDERLGVEDPRAVCMGDAVHITYVAAALENVSGARSPEWSRSHTPWRIRVSLASTHDFLGFRKEGIILPGYQSKDPSLFPEKINGNYALLHRIFPDIWLSFSDRITSFSKGVAIAQPRENSWDSDRIGAGAPPIKTDPGWLLFYHGVSQKKKQLFRYMLGIMVLDVHDPAKIIYRSEEPILIPEKKFERQGATKNVVFTCGAIEWGEKYWIYYGAADTVVCVASIEKNYLLNYLQQRI